MLGNLKKVICYFVILAMCHQKVAGFPFLYNSGQSILSSIFSSSANAGQSDSDPNIEDLRTAKSERLSTQRLDREEKEFYTKTENEEEIKNEASPGLIQKKIGKILAKLQLFSTLRNTFSPQNKPQEEHTTETDEFFADSDEAKDPINVTEINILKINDNETTTTEALMEDRKDTSNRISLLVGENYGAVSSNYEEGTKLDLTPGLGVYILELLGSLATTIYGAVVQVANIGVTTPAPNAF